MLPPDEIDRLARDLQRLANEIDLLKRQKRQRDQARHRARTHRKKIRELAWILADQFLARENWSEAIRITSHATGAEADRLEALIPLAQNLASKAHRARRDRQIMQMVAKGYTNAQIGERVGLHEKTVSRIVSQNLRST